MRRHFSFRRGNLTRKSRERIANSHSVGLDIENMRRFHDVTRYGGIVIWVTAPWLLRADYDRGLGDIAEEGPMITALFRDNLRIGGRLAGVAASAMIASTVLTFTPTAASAFDLDGLIGTAIALQMASQFRAPAYGHARSHTASRRDNDSAGGASAGGERDARETAAIDQAGPSVAPHRQAAAGPASNTRQASERDASFGQMAVTDRAFDDEPAYHPSR
jgi:hypothetical protein